MGRTLCAAAGLAAGCYRSGNSSRASLMIFAGADAREGRREGAILLWC